MNKINPKKTALLVIDVTNHCSHQRCEHPQWDITFTRVRKMIPKLKKFIDRYRDAGGDIIFVNCTPWKKKYIAKNLTEFYKTKGNERDYYSKDNTGFNEKFYQLKPKAGDLIVTKNTYDAFTNPKLDKYLKKNKFKYVLISGIFGDACVNSTIQGAFSAGHNLIILKDLIETTDDPKRIKTQKILKEFNWPRFLGQTINSEDLL